jgi:hypothetical protein
MSKLFETLNPGFEFELFKTINGNVGRLIGIEMRGIKGKINQPLKEKVGAYVAI